VTVTRILGLDPGYGTVGYGVVDVVGDRLRYVTCGAIVTPKGMSVARRLKEVFEDVLQLIRSYQPKEIAVEELFFVQNVTTGISVAMARGVILLAAAIAGREVAGYVPMAVKKAVTGHGGSKKRVVQEHVRDLLGLRDIPRPDDAADGLAIAICHSQHRQVSATLAEEGKR
jgi:crossover junction endodeoxyribonuclease RuvC